MILFITKALQYDFDLAHLLSNHYVFFFYTCHNNIHLQCFLLFVEWMKLSTLFNKGCLCILCEAGVTQM